MGGRRIRKKKERRGGGEEKTYYEELGEDPVMVSPSMQSVISHWSRGYRTDPNSLSTSLVSRMTDTSSGARAAPLAIAMVEAIDDDGPTGFRSAGRDYATAPITGGAGSPSCSGMAVALGDGGISTTSRTSGGQKQGAPSLGLLLPLDPGATSPAISATSTGESWALSSWRWAKGSP